MTLPQKVIIALEKIKQGNSIGRARSDASVLTEWAGEASLGR